MSTLHNETLVGRCSICGGAVVVPTVCLSVIPPTPRCKQCGAVKDELGSAPVVPMIPGPKYETKTSDTTYGTTR